MLLTVIIPAYNEEESLDLLHAELAEVASAAQLELEVIFVDDGSTDRSWECITRLAARDARVRGVRFRGNFGKAAALDVGFRLARGERVMMLDADLQDDPHEIPRFLAALDAEYDLVSGWKKVRHDPWHKVLPSRVFNSLVSRATGVRLHDHNCGMKGFRRAVVRELRLYGELHRFIPVLAAARGFRTGELVIHHRARRFGHSKYGIRRFLRGLIDLGTVSFLTRFGERPHHFFGPMALGFGGLALLGLVWTLLAAFGLGTAIDRNMHPLPSLLVSLLLLAMATNMLAAGLLAELLVANRDPRRRSYCVAETTFSGAAIEPTNELPGDSMSTIDWPVLSDVGPRGSSSGMKLP